MPGAEGRLSALPAATVARIGSGQIVTGPAAALKELLENALDAGATALQVGLLDHGLASLSVTDNGHGLAAEDLPLVARPHFTSKLRDFADLSALASFGFRGEALHALAQTSRLTVASQIQADQDHGWQVEFDSDGQVQSRKPMAMNPGTSVICRDFFHHWPVRRNRYAQSGRKREELKKMEVLCQAFALVYPGLRLTLHHNKKALLEKPSAPDLAGAIGLVLGFPTAQSMEKIEFEAESFRWEAFVPVAKAAWGRSTADKSFVFVNRRPVEHRSILRVLKQTFSRAADLKTDKFPICVLVLEIEPNEVDVNLDPNKYSVLLRSEAEIVQSLSTSLTVHYGPTDTVGGSPAVDSTNLNDSNVMNRSLFEKFEANPLNLDLNDQAHDSQESAAFEVEEDLTPEKSTKPPPPKRTKDGLCSWGGGPRVPSLANPAFQAQSSEQGENDQTATLQALNDDPSLLLAEVGRERDRWEPSAPLVEVKQSRPRESEEYRPGGADQTSFLTAPIEEEGDRLEPSSEQMLHQGDRTSPLVKHPHEADQHNSSLDLVQSNRLKQQTLSTWSLGRAVMDSNGDVVSPVTLGFGKPSSHPLAKRPKLERNGNESKPFKVSSRIGDATLGRLAAPLGTPTLDAKKRLKCVRKFKTIPISVTCLKASSQRPAPDHPKESFRLVGKLAHGGLWIALRDEQELTLMNHHRIEEQEIHLRLLSTYALRPTESLPHPINILIHKHWDPSLEAVLAGLVCNPKTSEVEDERVLLNGLAVKVIQNQDKPVEGWLVGVSRSVNFLGIDDLLALLKVIQDNPKADLATCRPRKVQAFLVAEAVRMIRQQPPGRDQAEAERLLELATSPKFPSRCLHDKGHFERFFTLPTTTSRIAMN